MDEQLKVFWTPHGERYHLPWSGNWWGGGEGHLYTGSDVTTGTQAEALERGRTPCQHCFPPTTPTFICH